MQTRLNQRMIEQVIVFAARHKREASHISEHGPVAILPVKAQQGAFLRQGVDSQIPTNRGEPLAQFFPIAPVPTVAETAEPLIPVRLRHCCACPDNLSAFASPVARSTDLIQSTKRRREVVSLGKRALAGGFSRAINIKGDPGVSREGPSALRFACRG